MLAAVLTRVSTAYLAEQPWVGGLFVLGGLLMFLVGIDLWSPVRRAGMWVLGAATALAAVAAYAVTALVGLPEGAEEESWWDTWLGAGLLSVSVYVLAMAAWSSVVGAGHADRSGARSRLVRPRRSGTP